MNLPLRSALTCNFASHRRTTLGPLDQGSDCAERHGVKPGGGPLMIMPSGDDNRLADADFAR